MASTDLNPESPSGTATDSYDVVIAGAGFAGLYLLHRCRQLGLSARAYEPAEGVGGTWYWNRYPGARCDVMSIDYSYSFDPELDTEWEWSEKYATQPEILAYANHVADRFDLRRDITFEARIDAASWNDDEQQWSLAISNGEQVTARHYVMATGCLSVPKEIDIEGAERFGGESYLTSKWPHHPVDFAGKRVAVIGTGSSAIQSIPIIAETAKTLTVFQRTPNFSMPAHNGPVPEDRLTAKIGREAEYREEARWSRAGIPRPLATQSALAVSEEERSVVFEEGWAKGELVSLTGAFTDIGTNEEANELVAEFVRNKIRSIVDDPEVAEKLCPKTYPYGTKRPCLDTGYYETFNRPGVRLVDLRETPLVTVTETGIDTTAESYDFDMIVYATGFDAMTGAIVSVDVAGRDGLSLAEKWADGPRTYLGLMVEGFPNFYTITGPGSPSVLSNMIVSIEQHVDWVVDTIETLDKDGYTSIEPTPTAEEGWRTFVNRSGDITLFPKADSWYMGANVPGKPRVFLPFVGGVDTYRKVCEEVVENDYLGFTRRRGGGQADKATTVDGIVRPLQLDVTALLEVMAAMDLPPLESLGPEGAREFMAEGNAIRPPGPAVGEEVSGTFPGAAGELDYRLYRPVGPGPHPVVLYFHGGGWVLGDATSDEPFCRDLCNLTDAIIVSVDYRHAPETRFPGAVDDAMAALSWVSEAAESLGGRPGPVAVCGWSAGGNLAAVVCQQAANAGGPQIAGQVLITPVTDSNLDTASYRANGEGYVLTHSLMNWFFDCYVDEADRNDPRVAPLRAGDLSGLAPAFVVAAEFDPLRDEGIAYADALAAAGVPAEHLLAGGHTHTSIHAVGVILSGAPVRERVAGALRSFLSTPVPA